MHNRFVFAADEKGNGISASDARFHHREQTFCVNLFVAENQRNTAFVGL